MSDRRGFVLIDILMDWVALIVVLAIVGIAAIKISEAAAGITQAMKEARYEAVRSALEELSARQTLHYAEELTYSSSPVALRYQVPPDVSVRITATGWGWAAAATHSGLAQGEGCAMYSGHTPPPAGPVTPSAPGEVACTD